MADLGDLGAIIGGTATGGVLGGLLSMGGKVAEFYIEKSRAAAELESKKVDQAHELAILDRTHDRDRQKHVEDAAMEKLKGELEYFRMSFEGLQASINDQSKLIEGNHPIAWVRPGLTAMLVLCALVMGVMDQVNPFYQFSSMASMAVAWWFGDRQFNRAVNFRARP